MSKKFASVFLAISAVVAPTLALAHDDVYSNVNRGYNPDVKCQQSVNDSRTTGGLLGAAVGAVAGSQVAARSHKTNGALVGAVLGAVVGSEVGKNRVACDDQYQYEKKQAPVRPQSYYDKTPYDRNRDNRYYQEGRYDHDNRYDHDGRYDHDNRYDHDGRFEPRNSGFYGQRQYSHLYNPVRYENNGRCGWGSADYRLPNGNFARENVYMCRQNGDWVVVDK